jgi:hypothetical protein
MLKKNPKSKIWIKEKKEIIKTLREFYPDMFWN